jgi:hypothetical protein
MIIHETLRMYPLATLLPWMMFNIQLGGALHLPHSLSVWIPVLAIYHDESVWAPMRTSSTVTLERWSAISWLRQIDSVSTTSSSSFSHILHLYLLKKYMHKNFFPNFDLFKNHILEMIPQKFYFQSRSYLITSIVIV